MEQDKIEFRKIDVKKLVQGVKAFFTEPKNPAYLTALILILLLVLGTWIRIQPVFLPLADNLARSNIENSIKTQIDTNISSIYPNLDPKLKQEDVNKQFDDFKKNNQQLIDNWVEQSSEGFKDQFRADKDIPPLINKGDIYLPDIDTYFWLRYAQNIKTKGEFYDEIKENIPYDNYMNAPVGLDTAKNIHNEVISYSSSIFRSSLVKAQYYVPVLFGVLGIIPAFFLGRRLTRNNIGGITTAFFYMAHPFALGRSAAGLGDTDVYNVFFPILIAWLFIETINADGIKKISIWSAITGLSIGIYSVFWSGWWFIFDVLLASLVISISIIFITHFHRTKIKKTQEKIFNNSLKNSLIIIGILFVSAFIFVSLFSSFTNFSSFVQGALGSRGIQKSSGEGIWPNVYTTVAELNIPSFNTVIASAGGEFLIILSLIGIVLLILIKKEEEISYKEISFLVVWYVISFYATTKGIRFVLLIVPAFCIAIGSFFGNGYNFLIGLARNINIKEIAAKAILILLIILLLVPTYNAAINTTRGSFPMMNDGWWNSLVKIREETTSNAIITSWWDFGHWFKAVADRRVTFDGASQGGRPAHTVGKILMTNEDGSIGLLRMYDCGHDSAYLFLENKTGSVEKTVEITNAITKMNKSSALNYLEKQGFSDQETNKLLNITHCEPPEGIFITSEDMVGKSGVWSHFGSWDFTKSRLWSEFKNKSKLDFVSFAKSYSNISDLEANTLYNQLASFDEGQANNWIGPFSGYSGQVGCFFDQSINLSNNNSINNTSSNILNCNGLLIDWDNKNALGEIQGIQVHSFVYVENNDLKDKIINPNGEVSLAILPDLKSAVVMDKKLSTGVFTRLFYYDGIGSKYFEKFSDVRDATGARIIVWRVKWPKI